MLLLLAIYTGSFFAAEGWSGATPPSRKTHKNSLGNGGWRRPCASARRLDIPAGAGRVLVEHGVIPIAVLDGAPRPCKAAETAARGERRAAAAAQAQEKLDAGRPEEEVLTCVREAAFVTTELVRETVQGARALGLRVVLALYEADGQLRSRSV